MGYFSALCKELVQSETRGERSTEAAHLSQPGEECRTRCGGGRLTERSQHGEEAGPKGEVPEMRQRRRPQGMRRVSAATPRSSFLLRAAGKG